jgi:hypothetical protein
MNASSHLAVIGDLRGSLGTCRFSSLSHNSSASVFRVSICRKCSSWKFDERGQPSEAYFNMSSVTRPYCFRYAHE